MTDWCSNRLEVYGDDKELKCFKEKAGGEEYCFDVESFAPYPEVYKILDKGTFEHMVEWILHGDKHLESLRKIDRDFTDAELQIINNSGLDPTRDGFNQGGYEWCCDNWGTKWPSRESELEEKPGCLIYSFETAWNPPTPVIVTASLAFPELDFILKFWSDGVLKGTMIIRNGKII